MEDIAFILTFIITVISCLGIAVICNIKINKNEITNKKAKWFYSVSALLISILIGLFLPVQLSNLISSLGITQDFGHGGIAITAILNIILGALMIPVGIIIINWKPLKW